MQAPTSLYITWEAGVLYFKMLYRDLFDNLPYQYQSEPIRSQRMY